MPSETKDGACCQTCVLLRQVCVFYYIEMLGNWHFCAKDKGQCHWQLNLYWHKMTTQLKHLEHARWVKVKPSVRPGWCQTDLVWSGTSE